MAGDERNEQGHAAADDAHEEALARIAAAAPEDVAGLSNHAPMVSEALVVLGHGDAVARWLEGYARRLESGPRGGRPLEDDARPAALGDTRRFADWRATFARRLASEPWQDVVAAELVPLLPAVLAAGTHGVIRVGHAVRALERRDTALRRDELAASLAYWASRYAAIGTAAPRPSGTRTVAAALAGIPDGSTCAGALIGERARHAAGTPGFAAAVDALASPAAIPGALSALTATMARWYLANAETAAIGLVHTVTAPAALRRLLPYLSPPERERAFAFLWQGCAAIRASLPLRPPASDRGDERPDPSTAASAARALESGGAHAIKFVEACRQEDGHGSDAIYRAAAADAAARLRL